MSPLRGFAAAAALWGGAAAGFIWHPGAIAGGIALAIAMTWRHR